MLTRFHPSRPARYGKLGRGLVRCLVVFSLFALAACNSTPVAYDLTQTQANQIVALLNQHGIGAVSSKETGGRGRFTVQVKNDYYAQAVTLINEKGLPGEAALSFSDLVAQQGLMPASREMEALKLDHAMAAEIEEILQTHPGIAAARAVVRMNSNKANSETAVSLVLQEKASSTIDKSEIIELVARAVPGIKRESIFVSAHKSPAAETFLMNEGALNTGSQVLRVPLVPFLLAWRVPEDDYNTLAFAIIGCFMLIGMIGGIIGYYYGFSQQGKIGAEGELPDLKPRTLKLDRSRRDLPEN